jgi:hypothetical protein
MAEVILAARDRATEQSVGEDAEQVKDGDQEIGSHRSRAYWPILN